MSLLKVVPCHVQWYLLLLSIAIAAILVLDGIGVLYFILLVLEGSPIGSLPMKKLNFY